MANIINRDALQEYIVTNFWLLFLLIIALSTQVTCLFMLGDQRNDIFYPLTGLMYGPPCLLLIVVLCYHFWLAGYGVAGSSILISCVFLTVAAFCGSGAIFIYETSRTTMHAWRWVWYNFIAIGLLGLTLVMKLKFGKAKPKKAQHDAIPL
eukprot:Awhi_evm3s9186